MPPKTLVLLSSLAALSATNCVKKTQVQPCTRPDLGGCEIDSVDIVGNHAASDSTIEDRIATAESSHVLGGAFEHVPILSLWDKATVDYERFDPFVLERDLARIERFYRSRGYYEAHVRAGRVIRKSGGKVAVEIVVDEGKPVKITRVDLTWKDGKPPADPRAPGRVKSAAALLKAGAIFEEEPFEETKKKILRALTDHGFAYAKVEGKAAVDLGRHEAALVYTLDPGPRCTFGDITLEGQGDLPAVPLLASLQIRKGDEFSTGALDSAQVALGEFGVFGSIDAEPKVSPPDQPPNPVVPVVFHVQRAPLRAVKLGGGFEVGGRVEMHGIAGWEHRNLFGGLRKFSFEVSPALTLHPLTFESLFNGGKPSSSSEGAVGSAQAPLSEQPADKPDPYKVRLLPELKVRATLTQPGVLLPFDARTRGIVAASFSIYRLPTAETTIAENVGYIEGMSSVGLERPFWDSNVTLGLSVNFQYDDPFAYFGSLPTNYEPVRIPYLRSTGMLDLRRSERKTHDPLNPHSGLFVTNDVQLAVGDAKDIRIRPEVRGYIPLPKRITVALRLGGGFLFPLNDYGANIRDYHPDPTAACRGFQLLQFRGFTSGGANSNRGYPYNGVGSHETTCLSILQATTTPVATGGFYLWETSAELRLPIIGDLGSAFFVDASDVSRKELRLCAPHISTGFGLRYDTPVGPFRADIGYRIPGAQVFPGIAACKDEPDFDREANSPIGKLLGQPLAVSVAIGQAF